MISAPEEDCFDLKNASYAMGWLNADYRGTNVVFHSGGLSGFNTQVGFLPGTGDGYCLCFNTGSTPAHRVARAILLDSLVDGEPKDSYDDMIAAMAVAVNSCSVLYPTAAGPRMMGFTMRM